MGISVIIDFGLIIANMPLLLHGLLMTLKIAILSSGIGIFLGTFLAFVQAYAFAVARMAVTFYVVIIRGTPMLIQVLGAYYILPQFGLRLEPFLIATIAIGLNSAAYISQIIRSGIGSINTGQIEAAQVLGFSKIQIIWYILLPQTLIVTLPSLGNEFVTLIKDSSLASIIGVAELSKQGRLLKDQTWDACTVFFAVTIIYLTITSVVSLIVSYVDNRLKKIGS